MSKRLFVGNLSWDTQEDDLIAAFELEFGSGKERITTARGWIGDKSGKGSLKSLWELEGERNMHGHVEVPAPLQGGAALWIDLEVDGKTETVSVPFR